ncbi:MAG TPA: carboxypeptidase-like regulatory domain-containing protein [Anaeromyxobacter sp.]
MRVRPLALIVAIFGAAAAAAAFVVSQMPREGQLSPPASTIAAVAPAERSPPLAPPATPADGFVEVRVTTGGEPQAEAEVRLYAAPAEAGGPWFRAGEGRTDRAGVARLPARPGAFLAAARAAGLAPGLAEVVRARGEEATRVDVALEPAAALEGRASTPGGGPVEGGRVRAVPLVSRWPELAPPTAPPEETAIAETDAAGAFRLAGLAPGSFAVSLEAAGHNPAILPRVAVPGDALAIVVEPLGAAEGTVLLADGRGAAGALVRAASADHGASGVAGADGRFRLPARAGSYALLATLGDLAGAAAEPVAVAAGASARGAIIRLGPAAILDGAVALPGGAPASGARVVLLAHETHEVVARATAAPDGRFVLRGLAPAAYDLAAAAPGASPALLGGVTLAAGARFPVRIALAGTGAVEGTVRDLAGHLLAGIRVRALQRGDGLPARAPLEARTGFDGRFRIEGVEVGRAELVVRHEAALLGASRAVRVAEGRAAEVDLVLADAGVLAGRVSDAGRPPPPGTTVVAVATRAGTGTLQVARATADASGNYALSLPAGEYRVHAAPGASAGTDLRVAPAFARVEPGETARRDLAFAAASRERGVELLVLEPGGAPSPGAVVTLARPDDGRIALATSAGEDGRVAVDGRMGMAGREVTIRARNGGRAGAATVTLPDSGTVAVRLAPGGRVEGVVRGARTGFTLEVSSQPTQDGWRTLDVHRFAGERFELGDLPPEPLRLVVRSDDGRRGAAEVRVGPGETRAVEIALR